MVGVILLLIVVGTIWAVSASAARGRRLRDAKAAYDDAALSNDGSTARLDESGSKGLVTDEEHHARRRQIRRER